MKPTHTPSNQTTESPLRYTSVAFLVVISLLVTLLMAGCTATNVEEPDRSSLDNDDLVVTISPGDSYIFPGTRADADIHADHKLRYIATLYESTNNSSPSIEYVSTTNKTAKNLIRRVEQLAVDGNNQVVFRNVPADKYYFVIVFADYIPDTFNRDEDGLFEDKYYDTHSDGKKILLKATDQEIFNNHNLDCFLYVSSLTFKKEAYQPKDVSCDLKRMVSQVKVVANSSGSVNSLKDMTVTAYSVINELDFSIKSGSALKTKSKTSINVSTADPDSGLLFYFYTLNAIPNKALADTEVVLNPNEGYEFVNAGTYRIPGGTRQIVPDANYIYTVKGDFLNTSQVPSNVSTFTVQVDSTDWIKASEVSPNTEKTE